MDVKSRLVNYYQNNQFIQKYIKGLNASTNEIVLVYNGKEKNVSIDILEKLTDELSLINFLNQEQEEVTPLNAEVVEEPTEEIKEETPIQVTESVDSQEETLNDIKILTELKNKSALDNILRKFAVNESTGLIDINKAIEIVENNTIAEVINSINENYAFDLNAINYDIQGRLIGEKIPDAISADEKIVSSFNNIKVYLEAAKMYPEQYNYSDDQINVKMGEYIKKVKSILNNKPVEKKAEEKPVVVPTPVVTPTEVQNNSTANAGFADVLVLAVIVLVYAIIIVNLILKLK